jgi:hypothetical protein
MEALLPLLMMMEARSQMSGENADVDRHIASNNEAATHKPKCFHAIEQIGYIPLSIFSANLTLVFHLKSNLTQL